MLIYDIKPPKEIEKRYNENAQRIIDLRYIGYTVSTSDSPWITTTLNPKNIHSVLKLQVGNEQNTGIIDK